MRIAGPPGARLDGGALIFAVLAAPVLGALATAASVHHFDARWSAIAFLVVAPVTTLAFARRRDVGWPATGGLVLLALAVTACWIGLLSLYMAWGIGNAGGWDSMST